MRYSNKVVILIIIHLIQLTILACTSSSTTKMETSEIHGKWIQLNDSLQIDSTAHSEYFYFFDSVLLKKYIISRPSFPAGMTIDGKYVDVWCYNDTLSYVIDSITHSNRYWISTRDKQNNPCTRFYLYVEGPLMYVTELKSRHPIADHFTDAEVYLNTSNIGEELVPILDTPLIFDIQQTVSDSACQEMFFYIAYGQNITSSAVDEEKMIRISQVNTTKTTIEASIKDLFFFNYRVIFNGKEIPVVNDKRLIVDYDRRRESVMRVYNIGLDDTIAVIGRYNPGRERVVNPAFQEDIEGQVQDILITCVKNLTY